MLQAEVIELAEFLSGFCLPLFLLTSSHEY